MADWLRRGPLSVSQQPVTKFGVSTMTTIHSYGFGLATENSAGEVIEVYYAHFGLDAGADFASEVLNCCGLEPGESVYGRILALWRTATNRLCCAYSVPIRPPHPSQRPF